MKKPRNRKAQDTTLLNNDARKAEIMRLRIVVRRLAKRVADLERGRK